MDPTNVAWNSSRKPLVAHWQTTNGQKFYTINVHDASKVDGGSSIHGAPRPPINSDVDQRTAQVKVIAVRLFLSFIHLHESCMLTWVCVATELREVPAQA